MMSTREISKRKRKQRGIALLIVIFALLLVTGIALAMMNLSDTDTKIETNYRESQKAYFSALAGIQEARVRLTLTDATAANTTGTAGVIPTGMPDNGNQIGVVYIVNPKAGETVDPHGNYPDDELCNEYFPGLSSLTSTGLNSPCGTLPNPSSFVSISSRDPNTGSDAALDYKWVRITQKANQSAGGPTYYYLANPATADNNTPVCWDGKSQLLKPSSWPTCDFTGDYTTVYRVASLAQRASGARRMVLAEVAKNPPLNPNASLVSKDNVVLNGALDVNGFDYCSCDITTCKLTTIPAGQPGEGTKYGTCDPLPGKTCNMTKLAVYAQGDVQDPTGKSENIEAGPNPPVVDNVPVDQFKYDIPKLVDLYKNQPGTIKVTDSPYGWNCTSSDCGTHSNVTLGIPPAFPPTPVDNPLPDSSYGPCNTSTTPWTGSGCPTTQVTYVGGNVQLTSNNSKGSGILVVDGDLDINGGLQFYGLILVKGVIKFTGGGSASTNIYGAVMAGQESYVDNTLGGSAVLRYNMCALQNLTQPSPATLLSIREATY